jgi:hypothetical protein
MTFWRAGYKGEFILADCSPPVVDPDAVVPASIAVGLLEPVAVRHAEVVQIPGAIAT